MPWRSETLTSETQVPAAAQQEQGRQAPVQRQYVNFRFYKIAPEWWLLGESEKEENKRLFRESFEKYAGRFIVLSYSTRGVRAECDFMLWRISYRLEDFNEMSSELQRTGFGRYLS